MNPTSSAAEPKPRPVETSSQCHAVNLNSSTTSCSCAPRPAETSIANATSDAAYAPPIAESAIRLTPSLPMRLPKTPFTSAPKSGSPKITATNVKLSAGNMFLRRSIDVSVPKNVGLVAANRSAQAIDGEANREADRGFGGGNRDDEESEH